MFELYAPNTHVVNIFIIFSDYPDFNVMKTEKFITLTESCFAESKFDENLGIITDVLILGQKSRNNREYMSEAMANAVPLYEGAKCFLNHITHAEAMSSGRDVEKIAGRFEGVTFDAARIQIRGNMKILENDPAGNKLKVIAEQMPDVAGFSHNAQGKMRHDKGTDFVDEITRVISVDLVSDPATTNGIHENEEMEVLMDWSKLNIADMKINRADIYEALIKEGADGRNDEVNKLKEAKDAAEKVSDELTVKESIRQKETDVAKALKESKLPEKAITDVFTSQLMDAKPEDMQKLIEDRKELVANATGGVKGMGEGKQDAGSKKTAKEISESLDI